MLPVRNFATIGGGEDEVIWFKAVFH
jgi:hypothetical protein